MKSIIMIILCLLYAVTAFSAPDAAQVAGDLRVDGIVFNLDNNSMQTKASPWGFNFSDIYFLTGNVGIGKTNPTANLDVVGTVKATNFNGDGSGLTNITATMVTDGSITSSKIAPNGCSSGQILKYNGTAWGCAADANSGGTVTSVATGTGLTGGPITGSGTVSVAPGFQLPQTCTNGQIPMSNGAGSWTCNTPTTGTVTSFATGTGLTGGPITSSGTINLSNTQLLPSVACASTQIPQWNGSAWACAPQNSFSGNLTLPESTSASVGNILKGTTSFIHNFGSNNTFIGESAGNFSMTGSFNSSLGNSALYSNTTGAYNTAMGSGALFNNTTGSSNTALGQLALDKNTIGASNTATGQGALYSNTTGSYNNAIGHSALYSNTIGSYNIAIGDTALYSNTTGDVNLAIGAEALYDNTTGHNNTAIGLSALQRNTIGTLNTAVGEAVLAFNKTGNNNTAVGYEALGLNDNGNYNTAIGSLALENNLSGEQNTSIGQNSLLNNTTGSWNTAIGVHALIQNTAGSSNTAVGQNSLYNNIGDNNIALGFSAGSSLSYGSNNIDIGNLGVAGEYNTIRIGTQGSHAMTYIAGIYGGQFNACLYPYPGCTSLALPVYVASDGSIGTTASSRRFKENIADMENASNVLMKLRPVTFHYKTDHDAQHRVLQYGLIAEEVDEVLPDYVAHSSDGQIYTVAYQFLPPMLLNEYQKQQRTIEAQNTHIVELEKKHNQQLARIDALEKLTAKIAGLLTRQGNPDFQPGAHQ